jgi:hypothetical protein
MDIFAPLDGFNELPPVAASDAKDFFQLIAQQAGSCGKQAPSDIRIWEAG